MSVAWFNTSKDFQKMNNHDKPSLQTTTSLTSKQFRPNERSTTKVIQDKKTDHQETQSLRRSEVKR